MALQNLRSSTPSKRPDASSMSDGQIALNTAAASAGLFFKDSNGDLVKTGPVHIGTTAPNSTPATGGSTGNSKGEAWLDTSNGNYVLKIYDGTAFRSVEIAPGSARQLLQTNAAGTDVEFTSNVDVPGTLDVTGATTLDSTASVAGLLSANGKISFAAGSSAAPGIHPGSDTNTGISSPTADEISISTAGVSRLYIDNTGNLGINHTNPEKPLQVGGSNNMIRLASSTGAARIEYQNSGSSSADSTSIGSVNNDLQFITGGSEKVRLNSGGNLGVGSSNPSERLVLANVAAPTGFSDTALSMIRSNYGGRIAGYLDQGVGHGITFDTINAATPTERMRITQDGFVGIATSNPARTLHINSTLNNPVRIQSSATYSRIEFEATGTTSPHNVSIGAENNDFRVFTGSGTGRLIVKDDGKTGIGVTAPLGQLHVRPADEVNFVVRDDSTAVVLSAETNSGRDQNRLMALEAGSFTFSVSGTEKLRVVANGNLGLGSSNPVQKLHVQGTSNDTIDETTGTLRLQASGGNGLLFGTKATGFTSYIQSAFVADTSVARYGLSLNPLGGNTGVGTTSPSSPLHVIGDIKAQGAFLALPLIGTTEGGHIELRNPNGADTGAHFDVSTADVARWFSLRNNVMFQIGQLSGTGGNITLHTAGSERVRINSNGYLMQGTTNIGTVGSVNGFQASNHIAAASTTNSIFSRRDTNGTVVQFRRNTTAVGNISVTTTSTSYGTSSDHRLKENVVDIADGITRVKQLAPKRFNFIADADITVDGFLAHEAQAVVPEAVTGTHNEVDDDGNPVMQGIDQAKLVPLLTAALQEAIAKIETLETKVAALEAE